MNATIEPEITTNSEPAYQYSAPRPIDFLLNDLYEHNISYAYTVRFPRTPAEIEKIPEDHQYTDEYGQVFICQRINAFYNQLGKKRWGKLVIVEETVGEDGEIHREYILCRDARYDRESHHYDADLEIQQNTFFGLKNRGDSIADALNGEPIG